MIPLGEPREPCPRLFDVDIVRSVSAEALGWPEPGDAGARGEDAGFSGNRSYLDLRRMTWSEARRTYDYEGELIERIITADDPKDEYVQVTEELYEDPEGICGLDLGVAAAVVSLSAARCIPFSSCNGGAFGDHHHEDYPLVAFFARPAHAELLLQSAERSGCGLEHDSGGGLVAYARSIDAIRQFACELNRQSAAFRRLSFRPSQRLHTPGSDGQLNLL